MAEPYILKKGYEAEQAPGTWWGEADKWVVVKCPKCQSIAVLRTTSFGHDIAEDGKVSPSVVCPAENCEFHEMVKLEGWKGEAEK